MIFEVQTKTIFIPETGGNKNKPESEQIKVYINRPSIEERKKLVQIEMIVDSEQSKKGKNILRVDNDVEKILREHVYKLDNVQIRDKENDEIKTITTGKEFAKVKGAFGVRELIDEICAEVLRDELEEEDTLKNC